VVGARRSRSGRGRRGPWSMWSELGGAARDVIDVVRGRRGRSSAEPLGTWSTWSVVDVVRGQLDMARLWLGMARSVARRSSLLHHRGPLDGLNSLMWLACGSAWLAQRLAPRLAQRLVRLPCCLTMARPTWRWTHLVGVLMMS